MFLILLSLVFGPASQAIITKECPDSLVISYHRLVANNEEITANDHPEANYDDEVVKKIRREIDKAAVEVFQNLTLTLVDTSNSRCDYRQDPKSDEQGSETRLYTKNGEDFLRVALQLSPALKYQRNIWITHKVRNYGDGKITVKDVDGKILGYQAHSSPHVVVGEAYGLRVSQ